MSNQQQSEDETLARLLRAAGPRPQLPDAIKRSWSQVFTFELNQVIRRRRRRTMSLAAISAGLVALLLAGIFPYSRHEPLTAVARVVSVTGSSRALTSSGEERVIRGPMAISLLTTLKTADNAALALDYAGADVRLDENAWVRLQAGNIELIAGRIYVAIKPGGAPVTVSTRLAEIRHIGTQFRVASNPRGVTAAVREGAIMAAIAGRQYHAEAGPKAAQQLRISNGHEVEVSDTDKSGDDWDWILPVAPPFHIEGRTAYEFLAWSVGETGSKLVFADADAEQAAKTIVLHGDVSVRDPRQALNTVLATTRLVAEQTHQGSLLVKRQK